MVDCSVEWLVDEKAEWMVAHWDQLLADCSVETKVSSMAGRLVALWVRKLAEMMAVHLDVQMVDK